METITWRFTDFLVLCEKKLNTALSVSYCPLWAQVGTTNYIRHWCYTIELLSLKENRVSVHSSRTVTLLLRQRWRNKGGQYTFIRHVHKNLHVHALIHRYRQRASFNVHIKNETRKNLNKSLNQGVRVVNGEKKKKKKTVSTHSSVGKAHCCCWNIYEARLVQDGWKAAVTQITIL